MINIEVISSDDAETLCRKFTTHLPQYLGLPEVNRHYEIGVRSNCNFSAKIGDRLLSLNFPYSNNCNIYWMAIMPKYHAQSIGGKLIQYAANFAKENGAKTMIVETLNPDEADENYLKTYNFYLSNGFAPLINLTPKNYEWNMIYMMKLLNESN